MNWFVFITQDLFGAIVGFSNFITDFISYEFDATIIGLGMLTPLELLFGGFLTFMAIRAVIRAVAV